MEKRDLETMTRHQPGADSEFFLVEKRLRDLGYIRHPWETLSGWIERIEEDPSSSVSSKTLESILSLHYRYRFDPQGISGEEKAALKSYVRSWLEQHQSIKEEHQ